MEEKHRNSDLEIICKKIDEIKGSIASIKEILNGNGKLGLAGKVEVLWGVNLFMAVTMVGIIITLIFK